MSSMQENHMYLLPLTDKITVTRQVDANPDIDDWGVAEYETVSTEHACHIFYNYKLEPMTSYSGVNADGTVVTYTAKIYMRGLVDVEKKDKILFDDMLGNPVEKEILRIYPVRDFGGKVLATVVVI